MQRYDEFYDRPERYRPHSRRPAQRRYTAQVGPLAPPRQFGEQSRRFGGRSVQQRDFAAGANQYRGRYGGDYEVYGGEYAYFDYFGEYRPRPAGLGRYLPDDLDAYLPDDLGEYLPMGAVAESQERMGMRDFTEHYGRYSGGSPYSYEYSERTIYHRPRFTGAIGFTRSLGEERPPHPRRRRPSSLTRGRW